MHYKEARLLYAGESEYLCCGQGIAFGYLLLRVIAMIFLAVIIVKIIFSPEKRLYIWLALLVSIPFLLITLYGYL
jgi:hypothetical protein